MIRYTFLLTALLLAPLAPTRGQEPPPEPKAPEPIEAPAESPPAVGVGVGGVWGVCGGSAGGGVSGRVCSVALGGFSRRDAEFTRKRRAGLTAVRYVGVSAETWRRNRASSTGCAATHIRITRVPT